MKLFQINQLPEWVIEDIKPHFEDMPETDHLDGKYRLRKYSVVRLDIGNPRPRRMKSGVSANELSSYKKLPITEFQQSSEYNDFQGDVSRTFEPLSDEFVGSRGFKHVCNLFRREFNIPAPQALEVHQMKVITQEGGKLSPEGVHQDGFDYIAMAGISRHNITGGHLLLYRLKNGDPIVDTYLRDGEIAFVDDQIMWHNGSPLKRINENEEGHMDFLIVLAKMNENYLLTE